MRYSKCRLQLPLIENIQMFPVKHFERLKKTVYHTFRESILPYLPDSVFAKCFDSSIGVTPTILSPAANRLESLSSLGWRKGVSLVLNQKWYTQCSTPGKGFLASKFERFN